MRQSYPEVRGGPEDKRFPQWILRFVGSVSERKRNRDKSTPRGHRNRRHDTV
jgi:hypothetical protein